ncbi:hypothetical protein AKJ09_02814 [Labilithrix luteola]|uniref:Serine/threonine kinase n=1 Tax=Labilithrix luteola TaxID=1391654 RepID=A0A0K1PRH5_9BACT|nr:ergothioneine biosynthesis protein EgtB [Labilithrix luteola]AKU96150.1 hypothetical protein AKJ09_02814 [Labilithrix luteola]
MSGDRTLVSRVLDTRRKTSRLSEPLSAEDLVVQSMPDASPTKWHLAHTTWFFERFVLKPLGIAPVDASYDYLFNSYYEAVGKRHPRNKRGLLTRPPLEEVLAYRTAVDARIADLEGSSRLAEVAFALELGKHHEEQHQELILTDIKHLLGCNPLLPAYRPGRPADHASHASPPTAALGWRSFGEGVAAIGARGEGFAFDNERPRHKVYLAPFSMATRLVTCGEYLAFMADRGYERPELWLSEGWAWVQATGKGAPLYWEMENAKAPRIFTLHGEQALVPSEPICHVTYFEADAYARWAGARLPTEAEWEVAAEQSLEARYGPPERRPMAIKEGNFVEDGRLHPAPASTSSKTSGELMQMLGDVWEWTSSAYLPYPGFAPLAGAFGEYNGKFMINQMVLRGGSCATPRDHVRTTYRNFFPTNAEWQFSGIRLARDE